MNGLIDEIIHSMEQKQEFALATIIRKNGSAPRMAGAQMIVRADGSILGTVGGGKMEAMVMDLAREMIHKRESGVTRIEMTGESAATGDMICGGVQDVLVEVLDPNNEKLLQALRSYQEVVHQRHLGWWVTRIPAGNQKQIEHFLVKDDGQLIWGCDPIDHVQVEFQAREADEYHDHLEQGAPVLKMGESSIDLKDILHPVIEGKGDRQWLIDPILFSGSVYIFGAGHVSRQIAKITKLVGFRTIVIDDRAEFANSERFPDADEIIVVDSYDHLFDHIPVEPESYMVIVSRGHLYDRIVLSQCLKVDAAYTGMIGSKRKVQLVFEQLEKEGYDRAKIDRVYSPIGLKIGAETPEEIAVSITAELIQVRSERAKIKKTESSACCE